ncbi:hypothetical protein RFI_40370 [Reticulomyxa filosa]|uniref:Uncharacterized protein n=1 Tax=Reticulomyxa filosa TaxID=46433 RepID=X6L806_RETFI|nr:hypothetical protein RFI_40370 [Reticulomyxa filosa]|eukprot:ETN97161.1 hypothetical protein RFI_40370 [Reticulomyxa filosa]
MTTTTTTQNNKSYYQGDIAVTLIESFSKHFLINYEMLSYLLPLLFHNVALLSTQLLSVVNKHVDFNVNVNVKLVHDLIALNSKYIACIQSMLAKYIESLAEPAFKTDNDNVSDDNNNNSWVNFHFGLNKNK